MILNFIDPDTFNASVQLTIGVLTFVVAAGTLYITCLMYGVAAKALNDWKNAKRFDIDVEAIAQAYEALRLVHRFFDINYNEYSLSSDQFNDTQSFKIHNPAAYKLQVGLINYMNNLSADRDEVAQMSNLAQKIVSTTSNIVLKKYYNKFLIYRTKNYTDIPRMFQQQIKNAITTTHGEQPGLENTLTSEELEEFKQYYSSENTKQITEEFDQLFIRITGITL